MANGSKIINGSANLDYLLKGLLGSSIVSGVVRSEEVNKWTPEAATGNRKLISN